MFRIPAMAVVLVQLLGCTGSTIFQPYPEQASAWRQGIARESAPLVRESLERRARGTNELLWLQEMGRLAQLGGDHETSLDDFRRAIALYEEEDDAALIRLTGLGATGSALLTNDNALPYRGEDYERILLHGLQALNYWAGEDLEGAAVEFRRVTEEQRRAERDREREIERAGERAREEGIDIDSLPEELRGLDTAAAEARSSIENAWLYWLAGVFREGVGDYNNAIVDYRRALQIRPDSDMLREDLQRAEDRQNRRYPRNKGLVVISYEQALVPPRREVALPLPTRHGYVVVAFPTYEPRDFRPPRPLRAKADTGEQLETEALARIDTMAARALRERMPGMLLRQTLRARAKYEGQKRAEEFGILGGFIAQIYNIISERADLRSWLSLPANVQGARMELEPGEHDLKLWTPGGGATVSVTVPVRPGGITVVRVSDAAGRTRAQVLPVLEERRR